MTKKILVRSPQWLGDSVVSTLFLFRLKKKEPEAEIDVAAPPSLASIFKSHPAVHEFVELPYASGGTVFDAGRILREKSYDAVYLLPRSFRTALEVWLAKIPKRIGYAGDVRRFLLTDVFPYDDRSFYAHRYLKLIGEENLPLDGLRPFFPKADLTGAEASQLIGFPYEKLKKPFLGLGPASVARARSWEAKRFVEVAERFLKEKGGTVFLFGSQKESPVTKEIASEIGKDVIDTAGKLDLPQLGWLMSNMNAFLANDSGLMHVASAFDIPTVVLFGPSDPTWALPRNGRFIPLQHKEISCVPCLRNECVRFGSHYKECLRTISSDEVFSVLSRLPL
jgi:heptosyltransferase-2